MQQQMQQQQQASETANGQEGQSSVPKAAGASGKGKISNVVTKFSFATKGGIAPHNPGKTN